MSVLELWSFSAACGCRFSAFEASKLFSAHPAGKVAFWGWGFGVSMHLLETLMRTKSAGEHVHNRPFLVIAGSSGVISPAIPLTL